MILIKSAVSREAMGDGHENDEKRYDWQMSVRANYLLLGDSVVNVPVDELKLDEQIIATKLKWIDHGELIAGSFMCQVVHDSQIDYNDIDIYFKSKEDMMKFAKVNKLVVTRFYQNSACVGVLATGSLLNLIFGVAYDNPADLISHFDIRACSIALDPNANTLYSVRGAFADCLIKRIVYNPVPHNTTIARLIKYTQKNLMIDAYQRVFLAELIKDSRYNPELEITTGYRAVQK
jgi:hypothetical protein